MNAAVAEREVSLNRSASGMHSRSESDSYAVRFNRVAMLEAVLSIRDRRRMERRILVTVLTLLGVAAITAGLLGL